MSIVPTAIKRIGREVEITWSDGISRQYRPAALRTACPCALCREKKSSTETAPGKPFSMPVLSKSETLPLDIEKMEPVGNYAYNIHFSDGHNSGIYSFDLLYSLGNAASV